MTKFVVNKMIHFVPPERDLQHRHDAWLRAAKPDDAEKKARSRAVDLAKEFGHEGIVAAAGHQQWSNQWILDSGSAFDIVGHHQIPRGAEVCKDTTYTLATANGVIDVSESVQMVPA